MGETTVRQALAEYLGVHLAAKNYAARTRIEYTHDLEELATLLYIAGVYRVGEINLTVLERHLAKLDGLGLTGATRKRKTVVIRAFLRYLHQVGYLAQDLSQRLVVPLAAISWPRVLTQNEYQRLLAACAGNSRDLAMVTLVLQTGLRLSELTGLLMTDLQLPEAITVRGSNSRPGRSIPLNSKACEALQDYLSLRPATEAPQVFLNRLGQPLGNRGVEKTLAGYLRQANVFGASVQSLRHTFATHHVALGTSLKTVQEILGLADIRDAEVYRTLAVEIKRREVEEHAL
jgi:site-specific recombinase XerD